MEEVLDAALLLQQVTYCVAYLAGAAQEPRSVEVLFEAALEEVLQRRVAAERRALPWLTARERALVYKMRGRHFGYAAACDRMPPEQFVESCSSPGEVFHDGHWPHSARANSFGVFGGGEEGLREGMLRLWRRKWAIVQELPLGPKAGAALEVLGRRWPWCTSPRTTWKIACSWARASARSSKAWRRRPRSNSRRW